MSLPEELEELELPPPQLEVPPALFEVGGHFQQSMHLSMASEHCSAPHSIVYLGTAVNVPPMLCCRT